MMIAALAPLTAGLAVWLAAGNRRPGAWRRAFLRALVITGLFAVLLTELLSLVQSVDRRSLLLGWGALMGVAGLVLLQQFRRNGKIEYPHLARIQSGWAWILLLAGILIVCVTLLVALRTPPQTWDSLNYHMSRVAHWAQMGAVRPYATGIEVQNSMPPGAEMLVLQMYVLAGSDALVNLIGWGAVLASAVGASWIAGQLGARRRGQLLAALAVLTLPMAIVQASTTMTDAITALWLICAAAELLAYQRSGRGESLFFLGAAAGLAILTKQTAYAFLLPLALIAAFLIVRRAGWKRAAVWALAAMLIVTAVNLGAFVRSTTLYGSPLGPAERFQQHANQLLTPAGLISNLARNLSLHLGTPSPYINKAIAVTVIGLHDLLGLDPNDARTTAFGAYKVRIASTHEDTAGNGLHMLLILAFMIALIGKWKQWPGVVLWSALACAGGYLAFSLLYKWLMFGSRLQLPFFILCAPLLGWWLERWKPAWSRAAAAVLFLGSLPWLLSLDSRPLIPNPGRSFVGSILSESRRTLTFANGLYLLDPMAGITEQIQAANCQNVGIMLGGNSVEYPLWTLLNAQEEGVRIEWIVAGTPSARFEVENFTPCAVICENCPSDWDSIRGLSRVDQRSTFSLFLASGQE